MYMDEADKKFQERMKKEGKIKIPKEKFSRFVQEYFAENFNLQGNFDFITVHYEFFDEEHQVFNLNEGKWVNRPENRKVTTEIPSFITQKGYDELEKEGIFNPHIPERINFFIEDSIIKKENLIEELTKKIPSKEIVFISRDMMESILKKNGYTDIVFDHCFYSMMDMPSYNVYAKPLEKSYLDKSKMKELYTRKETKEYAEEGAKAYTDIGQMYSSYLQRDSKKEARSEEDERD